MKLTSKIKAIMSALIAIISIISILVVSTFVIHRNEIDSIYADQIRKDAYSNIHIFDYNGIPIYDGYFSESELLRLSSFHIIGDQNGSIPNSILSKESVRLSESTSQLRGYKPSFEKIYLTIDIDLQMAAYTLLAKNNYNGCIVVCDYTTGKVKTMVSTPTVDVYDTTDIAEGAFLNKATNVYVPGSVMKSVTVACLLENHPEAKGFTYTCTGSNGHITCYKGNDHGTQKLSDVLSNSCNCGIASAVEQYLLPGELNRYVEENLLGQVMLGGSISRGNFDATEDIKWSANGQSVTLVSPLSMVFFYNAIANGGEAHMLSLDVDSSNYGTKELMSEDTANYISNSLKDVVKGSGINCQAFAKTGTAEIDNAESHSWFICCLDDVNAPPYTVLVFIENGGSSSIAKELCIEFINSNVF